MSVDEYIQKNMNTLVLSFELNLAQYDGAPDVIIEYLEKRLHEVAHAEGVI